jgi:FMN-dependent NADH-azoreductase
MNHILQIDSSILGDHSVSRQLTAAIVARLRAVAPDAILAYRDVAANPLPQYTGAVAAGRGQPVEQRDPLAQRDIAVLDAALEEVLAADTIVIGAPMYNFAVPSQLKAWLDALAVVGRTFGYTEKGPVGLLGAKRVIVASSRGGLYGADTPRASADHQETYLKSFFGFLGVSEFDIVRAEGVMMGPEVKERALSDALRHAALLEAA